MKLKKSPVEASIYIIILSFMINLILVVSFKQASVPYNYFRLLYTTIFVLFISYILFNLKYSWVIIPIIPLIFYKKILEIIKLLINLFPSFINSIVENLFVDEGFYNYFTILIYIGIIVFGVIFYYIAVERKKVMLFITFGCILFYTFYFLGGKIYGEVQLFLILSLFLSGYNSFIKNKWSLLNKGIIFQRNYSIKWTGFILIFITATLLVVSFLPKNIEGKNLNLYENKYFQGEGNNRGILKNKYSVSSMGYQSDPKRLGGPIKIKNDNALIIKTDEKVYGLHLRGSIMDYYNGYMWQRTNEESNKIERTNVCYNFILINDYVGRIYNYDGSKIKKFKVLSILNTNNVFNPLYPMNIITDENLYIDKNDELSFDINANDYTVEYVENKIDINRLKTAVYKGSGMYDPSFNKYLYVSETIPDRVYDLTRKIIKGSKDNYSASLSIEMYLKANYPYSINTSALPKGRDFVDYFLFDEKKGSCTYYATAMVQMLRIAGIPSRYVEGFVLKSNPNEDGKVYVGNKDAHAWVEVYFNGEGWVTFDPTPGYNLFENGEIEVPDNDPVEEIPKPKPNPTTPNNPSDQTPNETPTKNSRDILMMYSGGFIFLLILSLGLLLYIKDKRKIKNLEKRIINSIGRIEYYGILSGNPLLKGETIREYYNRLSKEYNDDFSEQVEIIEGIIYGGFKVGIDEEERIDKMADRIKGYSLKKKGFIKFYLWLIKYNIIIRPFKRVKKMLYTYIDKIRNR